ncbi:MAG: transcription elongation factor GreA [Nitrospirae bacterium]|nr:transcription elongation factor GreA [Nitrospirota bacterium]
MSVTRIPMTKKGYQQLCDDLERLKKIERPKNIQDIAEARAHGDLSENAEYHAAKERQSFIEGRIRELESKIAHAEIIDTSRLSSDKIVFGASVNLCVVDNGEEKCLTLVGQDEVDLKNGKISIHSPVGKALIGRRVGEVVKVTTPVKVIEYEVINIFFKNEG